MDPTTHRGTSELPAHTRVVLIGAGFGGLGLAIRLSEAGQQDFVVVERGPDVGGTWRDNTYPGAACDVPSQLYSFSFALNPDWSRSFSSQQEIQEYLRRVAAESTVLDRFRFDTTVQDATWDEGHGTGGSRRPPAGSPRTSSCRLPAPFPTPGCLTSRASRPSRAWSSTPRGGTTTTT